MKILVISDSFKGTLSSKQVGDLIREELSPWYDVDSLPVSDGGEGFLDAWSQSLTGEFVHTETVDPLRRPIQSEIFLTPDGITFIESAKTCGLGLLDQSERNPMITSTYGLGLQIAEAIRLGAGKLMIGLGGSATNDGGTGMLQALGARFLDENGSEIKEQGGKILTRIRSIDLSQMMIQPDQLAIYGVCDVLNPLLGPNGATRVYGPQKGADQQMCETLEIGMIQYASLNQKFQELPGSGAAGGLGFALLAFLGADLIPGVNALMEQTGLLQRIGEYDLIITGEGSLDQQSRMGKLPWGVLQQGQKVGIPVVCVCGKSENVDQNRFTRIFRIVPDLATEAQAQMNAARYLRELVRTRLMNWLRVR